MILTQNVQVRAMAPMMVNYDKGFPVADATLSGWLYGDGARTMRTQLLDCLADAPGALVVDIGDTAGMGAESARALADVGRLNASWPRARLFVGPLDLGRESQLRRAGVFRFAKACPSRSAAIALADVVEPPRRVRETLPPTVEAPASARALVARTCDGWGRPDLVGPAQLMVSELVTNGVTHAATSIDLTMLYRDGTVSMAVGDRDPRPPRRWERIAPTDPTGRGALLMDSFAASWGHLPRLHGKVVWAELTPPRSA